MTRFAVGGVELVMTCSFLLASRARSVGWLRRVGVARAFVDATRNLVEQFPGKVQQLSNPAIAEVIERVASLGISTPRSQSERQRKWLETFD